MGRFVIQAVRLANELKEGLLLNALSGLLLDDVCRSWELGVCMPTIRRLNKRRAGEGGVEGHSYHLML